MFSICRFTWPQSNQLRVCIVINVKWYQRQRDRQTDRETVRSQDKGCWARALLWIGFRVPMNDIKNRGIVFIISEPLNKFTRLLCLLSPLSLPHRSLWNMIVCFYWRRHIRVDATSSNTIINMRLLTLDIIKTWERGETPNWCCWANTLCESGWGVTPLSIR